MSLDSNLVKREEERIRRKLRSLGAQSMEYAGYMALEKDGTRKIYAPTGDGYYYLRSETTV